MKHNTDAYICPVCSAKLYLKDRSYVCDNSHCFDIAKEGYVNLLTGSSASHGDDKTMINARRDFLRCGHYEPLREKIYEMLSELMRDTDILDCGCGEGYYTERLCDIDGCRVWGIDISKNGVKKTASLLKGKNADICVGSVYGMPYASESFGALCNVFSPLALDEYKRVLKKDGYYIMAVPRQYHLYELKKAVYENVHIKDENNDVLDGFELVKSHELEYKFEMTSGKQIMDLFTMTPYYYTSPKIGVEKLAKKERLICTASFGILAYRVIK